jgi:AcrR family transcriptional regulator
MFEDHNIQSACMSPSRSNVQRSAESRAALLDAARALFVVHGYSNTSTPSVCAAAGLTRGALYHHFADKRDLFHAVLEREVQVVAKSIEQSTHGDEIEPLLAGGFAYLEAMAAPGRTRLLLIEGPAVLGRDAMRALEAPYAEAALRNGLESAGLRGVDLNILTGWLSAAFDRAAMDMEEGASPKVIRETLAWLLGLVLTRTTAMSVDPPRR